MRVSKSWVSTLTLGLLAAPALAVPRVNALYPVGGQRGQSVAITLSGEALKDLSGVWLAQPGLQIALQPGGDAATRTARVTIAPDATPGLHELRFIDGTGLSNVRYFRVGTLPEIAESEPNDDSGQRVSLPVTINGRIAQNPDQDSYRFTAKAGEKIVCEIEGIRVLGQVGDSWLKGYLEVKDSKGKVLASSEGMTDTYYRWDPLIVFTPPRDDEYTVTFRDLNFRGDIRSVYRLTLGAVPHATGLFPMGGQRGTTVQLGGVGANLLAPTPVAVAADAPDLISLAPAGALNARPFQASNWPDVLQSSDDQRVPWPCVVNGRLRPDQKDTYHFRLEQKSAVALEVFSRRLGTPADPELFLYNAKGEQLQYDDDGRGADAGIVRTLDPGEYTVAVRDLFGRGGPEFGYRLQLAPPQAKLGAVVTPDTARVARGQTQVLHVRLERENEEQEIDVTLEPVPGVGADPITIPKGKTEGDITIRVAGDAPLGPVRLRVIAQEKGTTPVLKTTARGQETYNLQGTAFQRDTLGPVLLLAEK